jgi:outer membrane protein assembly factor BamA
MLWAWLLLLPVTLAAQAGADAADVLAEQAGLRVASVQILGHRHTRTHIIERELQTRVGGQLAPATLTDDLQRLENLDVFSSIRVAVEPVGKASVKVIFHVRELPPVVPYITYDVTDQDGWSFGPAVKSVNLFGRDIFLAGYALFGGRTSYLIDFSQPWMFGDHVSLDFDASRIVRQNDFDGFEETSTEVTPRLGAWIGDNGRVSVALSYLRFQSDLAGHTLSSTDADDLFRLGGSAGYDSRDDWSNPTVGWWSEAELWKTGGVLPGEGDFWTVNLDGRRFQPAAAGHTIVLASLLTLQSGQPGRDLPQYMDFHLGGANSLRGYDVADLGATLYGKQQLLTTMEYRVPLVEPTEITLFGMTADLGLGFTLFADGGLAWTEGADFSAGRARFGAGGGLRLLLPAVDMTRLEVGYGERGWSIHFASFSKMRAQRLRLR